MAKQIIKHGATIETVTPAEMADLLRERPSSNTQRVRAIANVQLDAGGNGQVEVYQVPIGFQFETRRVSLDFSAAHDPQGGISLTVPDGRAVEYLRSSARIEYAQPQFGANVQIPGVQTWGAEQGPYLRNGEVFEVLARLLPAAVSVLLVTIEGVLREGETARARERA